MLTIGQHLPRQLKCELRFGFDDDSSISWQDDDNSTFAARRSGQKRDTLEILVVIVRFDRIVVPLADTKQPFL